jgi:phage terminase large subunit-like protein
MSGRGFGKTRSGSEFVNALARSGKVQLIALIGKTPADVRDTMIEVGESGILSTSPPWFKPNYEPSKRRLTYPNGVIAIVYSGEEPDQLRGPQHGGAWLDELAKFKHPEETWDNLMFGLRIGDNPQVVVTTTPRPIPTIKKIAADPTTVITRGHTLENKANLSPSYLKYILGKYEGTRLGRQELAGEILDDNPNALWKRQQIDDLRVTQCPELTRIVVGVDPEASSGENSAETGIIVAGIADFNGTLHGYVLSDASLRGTPNEWACAAVTAFHKFHADRIVAEVNQGGDMVESTIRTADGNVPVTKIHASRGKVTRAEPVSALYEQGRVHHVGAFPELEDQLCEWVPGEKSPDRLDAMVHALTELMLQEEEYEQIVIYDPTTEVENSLDIGAF